MLVKKTLKFSFSCMTLRASFSAVKYIFAEFGSCKSKDFSSVLRQKEFLIITYNISLYCKIPPFCLSDELNDTRNLVYC